MLATVQPTLIGQLLRHLPRPLLKALDAWSHRIALRRAEERQRKWAERKAATAAAQPAMPYQLKPWRD